MCPLTILYVALELPVLAENLAKTQIQKRTELAERRSRRWFLAAVKMTDSNEPPPIKSTSRAKLMNDWLEQIQVQGFALIPRAIEPDIAAELAQRLSQSLQTDQQQGSPLASRGTVYAARNPLQMIPHFEHIWQQSILGELLNKVLGADFGLVRGLFFDKPPGRSWWLPWHKDLTIAVKNNQLPSEHFTRPTHKAGVPHVIAPVELLEQMLTIRLHLDEVTEENGPLRVIPGSHLTGKEIVANDVEPATIFARAGDALAMRPLLSHASGDSLPDTQRHRRILHLEFAASEQLPAGFEWQQFIRGTA